MPGAQKISRERTITEVEIKVRLSWEECGKLLRLIYIAQGAIDTKSRGDEVNEHDRAAIAFSCDLKAVVEEAMGGEANKKEM